MLKICADIYPKIQFEISIKTNSHGATFPTPTLGVYGISLNHQRTNLFRLCSLSLRIDGWCNSLFAVDDVRVATYFQDLRSWVIQIYFIGHEQILAYAVSNLGLLRAKFYEANALLSELAGPTWFQDMPDQINWDLEPKKWNFSCCLQNWVITMEILVTCTSGS